MSMYIPQTLASGRYSVGDLIGHGGMAEVHIGTDTRLGRTVAIKIMRSDLASDEIFLKRFHKEALSVAKLNNPNIVAIYDSGDEEFSDENGHTVRVPYIVMEYIKGQTLRDIIKRNGALSENDTAQVMIGVLSALEYSHRAGIIHRDIKPGNIMISDQGIVKVMDFGISRAIDDSQTTMTKSQGVVGTAQYLSPEQARGQHVDMRSDLYSAGCVLYEMLTGRPPFTGDSAVAIAYQHVSENAKPPSDLVPGLPKEWDAIVAKAMEKNRANRYATAGEFRDDIVRMMNHEEPLAASGKATKVTKDDLQDTAQDTPPVDIAATPVIPQSPVVERVPEPAKSYQPPAAPPFADGHTEWKYDPETGIFTPLTDKKSNSTATRTVAIIAVVVLVVALVVIGVAFFTTRPSGNQTAQTVTVPTIEADMSRDRAKERIESAGLVFQYMVDSESTQPAGTFTKQDPEGGTSVDKGSTVTCWFSDGPSSNAVPDVSNMTQSEAQASLKKSGFDVGTVYTEDSATVSKDSVTRTDPASGESAKEGTKVDLYISNGMTTVPSNLAGASQSDAQSILARQGFSVVIQQESSTSVNAGLVTRTSPSGGEHVEQGSQVTLYISTGPQTVPMPSLIGMTYENAQATLQSLGLKAVRSGSESDDATVTAMTVDGSDVNAGDAVGAGSTVTLTMTAPVTPTPTPTPTAYPTTVTPTHSATPAPAESSDPSTEE